MSKRHLRALLFLAAALAGAAAHAATLGDLDSPAQAQEQPPPAPVELPLAEVYHDGAFGLVYALPGMKVKEGDRVLVRRLGRQVGDWVVTHVARDLVRGRFEALNRGDGLRPGDTLDLSAFTAGPPPTDWRPPVSFTPQPSLGASLFTPTPFDETGGALAVGAMQAKELVTQGGFVMDGELATTSLRVTPMPGHSLSWAMHASKLTTQGAETEVHTTLLGLHYSRPLPAKSISSRLYPSLGALAVGFDTDQGGFGERRYFGYATLSGRQHGWLGYGGLGFLSGTGYGAARPSLLVGLHRAVGRRIGLSAGYASRDVLKETTLNTRLPYESANLGLPLPLSCAQCRQDALSFGLSYSLGPGRGLRLELYDALDLAAPGVTLESRF